MEALAVVDKLTPAVMVQIEEVLANKPTPPEDLRSDG
jgi:hypothetical protein